VKLCVLPHVRSPFFTREGGTFFWHCRTTPSRISVMVILRDVYAGENGLHNLKAGRFIVERAAPGGAGSAVQDHPWSAQGQGATVRT